jgi:hypothetical protein
LSHLGSSYIFEGAVRNTVACVALALAASACSAGSRCQPGITPGGVIGDSSDGGTENGGLLAELASRELTGRAIEANPGYVAALEGSENERIVLAHLVECALTADVTITVHLPSRDLVMPGLAGYGAEWANGPCREDCQEWVTACNIARVNYYGIPVRIYFRSNGGIDAAPPPPEDLKLFNVEEGAFFGNMFQFPSRIYACRGRGFDPLYMTFRVCTDGEYPCGIVVAGPCGPELDGATGAPSERWACETFDPEHGTYVNCHGRTTSDGTFPPGKVFPHVITTLVRSTSFSAAGTETRCE